MQDIKNTPTTENEASQQDSKKDKRQRALRQREAICHQAMELARAGKRILPVGRDKRPLVKDWTQSASSDVKQVKEWWGKLPDANIGLVTGETNGFFVVDLDRHGGPDGVQVFETLCREKGVDIKTHKVGTPSGGQHLYFRYPTDGTKVTNKTSLLPGVDIRGDGGMIIYPPSCNGQGVAYTVLEDAEPAIPPAWLLEMVTSPAPGTPKVADHAGSTRVDYDVEKNVPYLNKVIENAVSQMEAAYTGNRNDTLFKCAVSVAPYIASGQLEELEAFAPLHEVAKLKGLDDGEINAVLDSAMKRGKEAPKTAPAPLHSYETAGKRNGDSFYKMPAFPEPPLCCFSDPVAKLLREASETYNVPLAVPVATLLALLSALVGCKRTITPKASWKEAGNLWIAIVAPSGLGKSPLARWFFSPLVKEDHKLFLDWRREMEAYKQNLREYERRKKASKEESFCRNASYASSSNAATR